MRLLKRSGDPVRIRTWDLLISLPLRFSPRTIAGFCGLDYLTAISGVPRIVSTEPSPFTARRHFKGSMVSSGLPYSCRVAMNLGFPDIAAFTLQVTFPCKGSYCAACAVHAEVSCSIQLSYGTKSNLNQTPFRVCPANVLYFYFLRNLAIKKSKKSHLTLWAKQCILEKLSGCMCAARFWGFASFC